MEADSNKTTGLNRLLIWGWAMYAVSFILPLGGMDAWGFDAFWVYFEHIFEVAFDAKSLTFLAINLSNVIMIASPLILSRVNGRALAILLLLGGLHNSRFLWEGDIDLTKLFPAYYVWWLSFFVTGIGLWKTPSNRA